MHHGNPIARLCAVLLLLAGGCGDGGGASPCTTAADCPDGRICAGGSCASCQADAQCVAGYGAGAVCEDGLCKAAECADGALGCPCLAGDTCTTGECVAGTCVECDRGAEGCVCYANGTCNQGLRCQDSLCAVCPPGEASCPCDEGDACDDGLLCQNGVCATDPCPAGTEGCPCDGDQCEGELTCSDGGLCAPCTADIPGCPCDDGECLDGLVCDGEDDTCREAVQCEEAGCVEFQLCAEEEGEDAECLPACEENYLWNGEAGICVPDFLPNCDPGEPGSILEECGLLHRVCVETEDAAECGDCEPGYTDEAGTLDECREVLTCAELPCGDLHRLCTPEGTNTDATCGDCVDGYMPDPEGGEACIPVPPPTCEPGVPGSILDQCTLANRECLPGEEGAACGGCLEGFFENELGDCIPPATCEELQCAEKNTQCLGSPPFEFCGGCVEGTIPSATPGLCVPPETCLTLECPADLYCTQDNPMVDASCVADPCEDPMQAWSDLAGACVSCDVDCNDFDEGETGRIWPFTKEASNSCICETELGYYWDDGDRVARPCDQDGDGWVRSAARSSIEAQDPWLSLNARCSLRTIDRFVLRNELQQELEIYLCQEAPTLRREDEGECGTWAPVPLYESVRNDRQEELDLALEVDAPAYVAGNHGRRLRANEVNPLTRACTGTGDYNHNGVSDISEFHGMPATGMDGETALFTGFSYWTELHTGRWEPGVGGAGAGRYVIAERSRCEDSFPLVYGAGEGDYWRSCTRSRDASWNGSDNPATGPDFGTDFAQWSCDDALGSCPIPPPPTDVAPTLDGQPLHGICEVPLPVEDGECAVPGNPWLCLDGAAWRGMSHHSQFRCVRVSLEDSLEEPVLGPDHFAKDWTMNACRVDCPENDPSCQLDCQDGVCGGSSVAPANGPNPSSPVIVCEAMDEIPQPETVGLALVRFHDGLVPPYQRGCINEWTPTSISGPLNGSEDPVVGAWRSLCPGWADDADATFGDAQVSNFGLLQCGCGDHYGGPGCSVGCATDELHLSPGYEVAPRKGWWMCGNLSPYAFIGQHPELGTVALPESTGTNNAVNPPATWVLRTDPRPPITDRKALCQDPLFCTCPEEGPCSIGYVIR